MLLHQIECHVDAGEVALLVEDLQTTQVIQLLGLLREDDGDEAE